MATQKKIPFSFVLDLLFPIGIAVKPMFGCYAIYVQEKIMLVLRNREDHPDANGIWVATSREHHASLKKEIPSLHSINLLGEGKGGTEYQMIHAGDENFERDAALLCELILKRDKRIGKIPGRKK